MRTRLVAVFGYKAPKEKGGGKFKVPTLPTLGDTGTRRVPASELQVGSVHLRDKKSVR